MDALVKRPQPGDPSFEKFQNELRHIAHSLERKAKMVRTRLNSIYGVHCNDVLGAMYAFPRVEIPEEAWVDCKVRFLIGQLLVRICTVYNHYTVDEARFNPKICPRGG